MSTSSGKISTDWLVLISGKNIIDFTDWNASIAYIHIRACSFSRSIQCRYNCACQGQNAEIGSLGIRNVFLGISIHKW
ncbi:hypothetical protein JRO89_XS07G0004800 [Xanthoceras sorbifolium]|uniref:Uncharacterized protein n=1 Tax=Xanthoceras sorbifolium TaxID=99658 RepID=A0ABQ8HRN8_9ROSI|nr:hypothetical protein JRO89_XS07G0004800 [Xanthoceras sorbifolium]